MKLRILGLAGAVLAISGIAFSGSRAQSDSEYADPGGKFKMTLVSEWRGVSYNDAVGRPRTEFVYRDRSEGLLKVTREQMNGTLADTVRQEEENLKIYRSGYERGAVEAFGGGHLPGVRLSFFSTEGARKMANTYYYLEDKGGVWVLRFSGKRGSLDTNRNLTDQIARSFKAT
jgi:hypothetical protein